MPTERIELTKEGEAALKVELDDLINVKRPEVIEQLQAARALGDLSENAEYDAARERQGQIEGRIKEIQAILQNAKIISEKPRNTSNVSLGAKVTILDLAENEEETYQIVGTVEANPMAGLISNASPLGAALIGHSVGDEVTVRVNKEYKVRILKIEFGK